MDDPRTTSKEFYIFYTRYPNAGPAPGWDGATLHRFTVTCQ
jgi:hypothetical protein